MAFFNDHSRKAGEWLLEDACFIYLYICTLYFSKIQLVFYYQYCILIGLAITRLYVIAHQ